MYVYLKKKWEVQKADGARDGKTDRLHGTAADVLDDEDLGNLQKQLFAMWEKRI